MWKRCVLASILGLAPIVHACGPSDPPDMPTYERDVRPILLARCVRCHGGGGTLFQASDGYFDHYDDLSCEPVDGSIPDTCRHGAATAATGMATRIQLPGPDLGHMPPPPAPPLTARQIEIIVRWSLETPPLR